MANQGSGGMKNVILAVVAVACLGAAAYLVYNQMNKEEGPQRKQPTGPRETDPYAQVPDEALKQMAAEGKLSEEELARLRAAGRLPAQ